MPDLPRLTAALHLIASPDNREAPEALARLVERAIADGGLDGVELGPLADAGLRRELAQRLRIAGLEVVFNAGPAIWGEQLDLGDPDRARRAAAVRRTIELLEHARDFGAPVVQVSPGPDRPDRDAALARTAAALRELAEAAAPMRIACEPYDRDRFARRLVGPAETARRLVEQVDHAGFGLLLDTSHLLLGGEDPAEAVAALAPHVVHAHVANCVLDPALPRAGDEHPWFGIEGGAVTPAVARAFVAALARAGYFADPARGRVGVEIKRAAGEPSDALLAGGVRFLRAAVEGGLRDAAPLAAGAAA